MITAPNSAGRGTVWCIGARTPVSSKKKSWCALGAKDGGSFMKDDPFGTPRTSPALSSAYVAGTSSAEVKKIALRRSILISS